jgi:hypothetical protein
MQLPYLTQFNPAAVAGYELPFIVADDPPSGGPTAEPLFEAYRPIAHSGFMQVRVASTDPVFRQAAEAVPYFAAIAAASRQWQYPQFACFRADKVPYAQVLALMGELHRAGAVFDSELANRQARAAHAGMPADCRQAYDAFLRDADAFLQKAAQLGVQALVTRKGVREVVHPFRALALMHGSSAVLVTPDPYDAQFVQVTLRSQMWRADLLALRELAYRHYEGLGLRVQLTET